MSEKRCKKYEKWLFLFREGELNAAEREQLERHLAVCPACAEKRSSLIAEFGRIRAAASAPPATEVPSAVEAIMRAVRPSDSKAAGASRGSPTVSLDWAIPRIRLALAVVILVLIGLFAIQEIYILKRLGNIEKRMAMRLEAPTAGRMRTDWTRGIEELQKAGYAFGTGKILVNENALRELAESYENMKLMNIILLDYLKERHPDVARAMPEKVDWETMQRILRDLADEKGGLHSKNDHSRIGS